jgi:hypothetical protein
MSKSNVVPGDTDDEVDDLLKQLDTIDVEPWLQDEAQTVPDHAPSGSTAEFIAGVRLILERAELSMDAASTPGYGSAPAPIKRIIESLFDPDMRERMFQLIMADSEQYRKKEERKYGQTYMQHIAGLTTR